MACPVTQAQVRSHLRDLGYVNITEIQLNEFMRDLKKLIKYEERQVRLAALQAKSGSARPSSSSSAYSSSSSHSDTPSREDEGSASIRLSRGQTRVRQRQVVQYARGPTSVIWDQTREDRVDATSASVQTTSGASVTTSTLSSRSEAEIRVRVHVSPQRPASRGPMGRKPTTSFIRPPIEPVTAPDPRRDPVQLHNYYQRFWRKFPVPGDEGRAHKDVRWGVREWMMGHKD